MNGTALNIHLADDLAVVVLTSSAVTSTAVQAPLLMTPATGFNACITTGTVEVQMAFKTSKVSSADMNAQLDSERARPSGFLIMRQEQKATTPPGEDP